MAGTSILGSWNSHWCGSRSTQPNPPIVGKSLFRVFPTIATPIYPGWYYSRTNEPIIIYQWYPYIYICVYIYITIKIIYIYIIIIIYINIILYDIPICWYLKSPHQSTGLSCIYRHPAPALPKPSKISGTRFKVEGSALVTPIAKPSGMPRKQQHMEICFPFLTGFNQWNRISSIFTKRQWVVQPTKIMFF